MQDIQRATDGRSPRHLARVWYRAKTAGPSDGKGAFVWLWRVLGLTAAEAETDDPPIGVLDRVRRRLLRHARRHASCDVRRQPHLHTVQLAGFGRAVAVAGENLVPVGTPRHGLRWREDSLYIDGAMAGRLGLVVDHNLAEISCRPQRAGRQHPD